MNLFFFKVGTSVHDSTTAYRHVQSPKQKLAATNACHLPFKHQIFQGPPDSDTTFLNMNTVRLLKKKLYCFIVILLYQLCPISGFAPPPGLISKPSFCSQPKTKSYMTKKSNEGHLHRMKHYFKSYRKNDNQLKMKRKIVQAYQRELVIDSFLNKCQSISPTTQFGILMFMYIFHLTVLTQHSIVFPFQLIPNEAGRFQSIGLDSLAGMFSMFVIGQLRKRQIIRYSRHSSSQSNIEERNISKNIIPSLFSKMNNYDGSAPWKFPKSSSSELGPKVTSCVSLGLLVTAYFMTGRLSTWIELNLYALAGLGFPMTIAMHRSLVVLGGHLAWVLIGSGILSIVLRPRPFFGGGHVEIKSVDSKTRMDRVISVHPKTGGVEEKAPLNVIMKQNYRWYTNKVNSNWLWWTIGGYFISSYFFNIADFLNQVILPPHVFEQAGEGVVSQLVNPENNDFFASLVGYIAPCLSAPWWEEVLYRGFLLPALCLQMNFWVAVFVSGIVFSVHHVSTTGAIPLAILGWTWATLYAKSGNLLVTILIHFMWNSRVFLGSWLGL